MKCDVCGGDFESRRSDAKYCSSGCRKKASRVTDNLVTDNSVTDNVTDNSVTLSEGGKFGDIALEERVEGGELSVVFMDVQRDLKLNLKKDLGVRGWNENGIFIEPEITVEQVRNIRRLVEARHGWEAREYKVDVYYGVGK